MSDRRNNISIPVDLTNPGQFFACCGVLELAGRLWPRSDGWFESASRFVLSTGERSTSTEHFCKSVIESELSPLFSEKKLQELTQLNERKAELKKLQKTFPKSAENIRKRLNSRRIAAGFRLGAPFNLRVDWWLVENCDGDHLKTWAGQQAIFGIASA